MHQQNRDGEQVCENHRWVVTMMVVTMMSIIRWLSYILFPWIWSAPSTWSYNYYDGCYNDSYSLNLKVKLLLSTLNLKLRGYNGRGPSQCNPESIEVWSSFWRERKRRRKTMMTRTSIAGAAEAVPPRGQDAPVHDLARHFFPSLPVQGGHPSVSLQVGLIKC